MKKPTPASPTKNQRRLLQNGWTSYSNIAAATAIMFILVTFGFEINSLYKERRGMLEIAGLQLQNQTSLLAEFSSNVLQAVDMSLVSLGPYLRDIKPGQPLPPEQKELIHRRNIFIEALESILVIDSRGNLLFNTRVRSGPPVNFSDNKFFRRHRDDWSELEVGSITLPSGKPRWAVSRSLEAQGGGFAGVIVGLISPDYFRVFYSSEGSAALDAAALVDETGQILAGWPSQPRPGQDLASWRSGDRSIFNGLPKKFMHEGGTGLMEGEGSLFSFQQLRDFPFRIVAVMSQARIFHGWWKRNFANLGMSGVLIIALAILIYATGRLMDHHAKTEKNLAQAEERTRWSRLLREIALSARESKEIDEVYKTCLKEVSLFMDWPLACARLDDDLRFVFIKYEAKDKAIPGCHDNVLDSILESWDKSGATEGWSYLSPDSGEVLVNAGFDRVFVIPIRGKDNFRSILAFFSPQGGPEDFQRTEMLKNLAGLLVRVIEGKRAEESLRKSEALLRDAQAIARLGGWELDLETGRAAWTEETRRIAQVGPDFHPDLEKTLSLFEEKDRIVLQNAVRKAMADGEPFDLELGLHGARGARLRVIIQGRSIEMEGKRKKLSGALQDVTKAREAEQERRALEEQLIYARKMEAVGTLAGGVAHDFNNVLQIISGYTQLMAYKKDLPAPIRKYVDEINAAAARAAGFVQRLLAFSRKIEPEFEPVDLNLQILTAAAILKDSFPENIEIQTDLAEDLRPALADVKQIGQVLQNLASNARHAMPDGGFLRISSQNTFLNSEDPTLGRIKKGWYIWLEISDKGTGIKPELLENIFDPFFTTKEIGEGDGMGLSIVYGIVRKHGGYVACRNAPDRGAIFDIYLPAITDADDPFVPGNAN